MEHASLSQHAALDDNEDVTAMSYIFSGGISRAEQTTEPQPNVIESSAGFSVRVLGRTGLRYQEGGRFVWVDSEVLAKPHAIAMDKDSIKYWEGSDPDKVSDADRDRIAPGCRAWSTVPGGRVKPLRLQMIAYRSPVPGWQRRSGPRLSQRSDRRFRRA